MAQGTGIIRKAVTNGPWVYTFESDGSVEKADIGLATIGAAIDALKPLVNALPGTLITLKVIALTKEP